MSLGDRNFFSSVIISWELVHVVCCRNAAHDCVVAVLVSMLYLPPPGLICLIPGSSYLLTVFTQFSPFPSLQPPSVWRSPICSLCLWVCLFAFCLSFLYTTHKWDHTIFLCIVPIHCKWLLFVCIVTQSCFCGKTSLPTSAMWKILQIR